MNAFWTFLSSNAPFLFISFLLGISVGAAEIISRFKDEPMVAVRNVAGVLYLTLNGVISLLVCATLIHYSESKAGLAMFKDDPLLTGVVAGLASMALMRSKLFTFKGDGGNEYAIGPDVIFSMFLRAIDRNIDRRRVKKRHLIVYQAVSGITDSKEAISFLQSSIASFQNLSQEERELLNNRVDQISRDESLDERLKLMRLGFMFLDITGEENYLEFMKRLNLYSADSSRRLELIFDGTAKIKNSYRAIEFLKVSLSTFPNLTTEDKNSMVYVIDSVLNNDKLTSQLKLIAVCTGFLKLAGEANFNILLELMRRYDEMAVDPDSFAPVLKVDI
jgi:hypothetical protein